ncbi:hypothetical protein STCU_12012 [Strigomonas culicis]|uniref:CW-type domain-containing protein n=1 Tax=Strigomonas culicis TaxID=28005 RepID=S9TBQ6_9TRYP|nr:hypothetical protein STCU_12012 [Strigomonas culicis]|eukprot:EPY15457.1 hypothetical protein STCU_12012 [Strigomonas culicis]
MHAVRRRRGVSPADLWAPPSSSGSPTGGADHVTPRFPDTLDFSFSTSSAAGGHAASEAGSSYAPPSLQQELLEDYGVNVPLFDGTVEAAQQLAQEDIHYVVLYMHCPTHEDTGDFVRDVLADDGVLAQFAECAVLVGCSVLTPEGDALAQRLQLTTYPALVVLFKRRVILTLAGHFATAAAVLQEWRACRDMWDGAVAEEVSFRAERQGREEARRREEQHVADMEARDRQLLDQLEREAAEAAAQRTAAEQAAAEERAQPHRRAVASAGGARGGRQEEPEADEARDRQAKRVTMEATAVAEAPAPPEATPAAPRKRGRKPKTVEAAAEEKEVLHWVQCDKCDKWRIVPLAIPKHVTYWECSMRPRTTCADPDDAQLDVY